MGELTDAVGTAGTTLVCAPSMGTDSGCLEFLSTADEDTTVLWVTFTRSPSACIEQYRAAETADGASLSVIAVGDTANGATTDGDVTVQTVSTPEDLTGLGITLSQTLSDHEDIVLCFDSLTVLLQYVDHETAYEFLNAVTGHLYATNTPAHFHLDPSAHDRHAIDALASLFDAVAERTDGGWSVRTRDLLRA
jgi:hypothetical protein